MIVKSTDLRYLTDGTDNIIFDQMINSLYIDKN